MLSVISLTNFFLKSTYISSLKLGSLSLKTISAFTESKLLCNVPCKVASEDFLFNLKNSKLLQKSNIKKYFLSSPSIKPLHVLVPLPIIWWNFDLLYTFLKNTKFNISGTSIPVSSISTDIAICGILSLSEKSSIRLWLYLILLSMTCTKLLSSGYSLLKISNIASAWLWFSAKIIVLPILLLQSILKPFVISSFITFFIVSLLNTQLFKSVLFILSGIISSSSIKVSSYSSFSSSVKSS